jgi:hypothetical protein
MRRSTSKEGCKRLLGLVAFLAVTCGGALPALAYVGPGAGLSLIGAFWGLLLAVFAALAFVVAWPLRRLLKRRRPGGAGPAAGDARAR